jgi:chromosome segregation ATPase
MNKARRNKSYNEHTEQMKKMAEGQSGSNSREQFDPIFKERFNAVVSVLSENTDRCLAQCYNYQTSWNQHGVQEHYLTENMTDELNRITKNKADVRTMFGQLPTPSNKYWDCYVKVKKLNNLYEDTFKTAVEYRTNYSDFSRKLSDLNSDFITIKGELNACRDSFK